MANERDTDRMAGDLMKALLGSLNKPVAGTGQTAPTPQVDEKSMLDTIKGFLNQSLPGTKDREKPGSPSAPIAQQTPIAPVDAESAGWEGMFRRQGLEREAMHARHERERAEMHQRHLQEVEASTRGQGSVSARQGLPRQRNEHVAGPSRLTPGRGRMRGLGAG